MDIDLLQLDLINKSKKYQNISKKLKIDITRDANNYFISLGKVPGYVNLKSLKEKKSLLIEKIITFLKNFFSISYISGAFWNVFQKLTLRKCMI